MLQTYFRIRVGSRLFGGYWGCFAFWPGKKRATIVTQACRFEPQIFLCNYKVNLGPALEALMGNFGLTLSIRGWLWVSLGPLWCHFGRSKQPSLLNLQKIHIFTMNFNDVTPLEVRTSGRFLGHSGLTLRPLLGNFARGQFEYMKFTSKSF